jgi:hypothetical protein
MDLIGSITNEMKGSFETWNISAVSASIPESQQP